MKRIWYFIFHIHYNKVKYHLVPCIVDFLWPSTKEAGLEFKICLVLFLTWSGKAWLTTMSWAGRTGSMTAKGAVGRTA